MEHQILTVHTDGRDRVKCDIMARAGMMLEDNGIYYEDMYSFGRDDLNVDFRGSYKEHDTLDALMQSVGFVWVDIKFYDDECQTHVYSMKDLLWNVEHYGWKTSDWKGVRA